MKDDKQILLVTQQNAAEDDPASADLYEVGTIGTVLQLLKLPDGTVKVLVEGVPRARIGTFTGHESFFEVEAEILEEEPAGDASEQDTLVRTRSEERRVGTECDSTCRNRLWA